MSEHVICVRDYGVLLYGAVVPVICATIGFICGYVARGT